MIAEESTAWEGVTTLRPGSKKFRNESCSHFRASGILMMIYTCHYKHGSRATNSEAPHGFVEQTVYSRPQGSKAERNEYVVLRVTAFLCVLGAAVPDSM